MPPSSTAHAQVAELRSRLAAIVDSADEAIMSTTSAGIITSWNKAAERIFGYSAQELVGRSISILIPADRVAEAETLRQKAQTGESGLPYETVRIGKDGKRIDVSLTITPIQDQSGGVTGETAIARDITARKQFEERLEASLRELSDLRAALDEHSIVAVTDAKGKITYVNDKFCAISRFSRAELLGQDHRLINSGYHSTRFMEELWRTIRQGQVWKGELRNRAKDGTFYWVDTTIVPFLDVEAKPHQFVAIRTDITAKKKVEEEIHQLNEDLAQRVRERTRQLEFSNRELEAFSYSVSHDLRAPVRHMDGFLELLRQSDGGHLSEKGRRYLEMISDASRQMGRLIDDLLVFSKMGRTEMQRSRVDLQRLVDASIEKLQPETEGRNIRWQKGALPAVVADESMLSQALINLLSNAIKYTRPREPARIEIGCHEETAQEVTIYVRDNGVGFNMEYANKLFGVFQRLHSEDQFEGTGIGLANVRRIITRHGGRTWGEGKIDGGATFYFSLPKGESQL